MNAEADPGLYRHLDEMEPWNDELQSLEVIAISDEADGVKTFAFRSDNQTWFRYRPGQFITLELPVDADAPIYRTYTLASSPSRPFSISVTVKAQPDSIGTRWMFENLKPGSFVRAYGPTGTFSLHNHPAGKYLFISAGSGVTPMMSMLRWLNDCAPWTDVAFINCARSPEDVLFRKELELTGHRMPGLSIDFLVEKRSVSEKSFGYKGRIDAVRLPLLVSDFKDREVFCCGPEPFMRAVREILEQSGFDMAQYHEESFGKPRDEAVEAAIETSALGAEGDSFPILFAMSETEGACLPDQTVLQAARANGVRVAAACELGLCGTCKVKKRKGEVSMNHNGGILDHEIEDGYILACCSTPLSPLEIEA
ncbi:MAG: hybrid-cluster NAD(P)-dependent oxidoreductase [Tepidamorphaceae bacterium]|nr:hybrid-cluster NAD(P)-dependent oxidoreductase [Rhodobiaceae bacterium]MCC0047759.1 hybrid-cluster NAD(P)-dependent oxidoreductase [Rhodobiaceae bacterium]